MATFEISKMVENFQIKLLLDFSIHFLFKSTILFSVDFEEAILLHNLKNLFYFIFQIAVYWLQETCILTEQLLKDSLSFTKKTNI